MQHSLENIKKLNERKWKENRQQNYISSQSLKRKERKTVDITNELQNMEYYESSIDERMIIKEQPRIKRWK